MSKNQPTAAKLSDSQLVILTTAAQRTDGSLLPFPQSLTAKSDALNRVVGTLCKRKLAEERRTINGAPEWRRDEEHGPLGMFITTNGLLALGIDDPEKARPSQAASMTRQRKTAAARATRKTWKVSNPKRQGRAVSPQSKRDHPDAAAAIRRHHRGHHRQNRLAVAFGAGFLQRPREKEAQAPPRLRGGQGRRAPLPHRPDRVRQGVRHGAAFGASPARDEFFDRLKSCHSESRQDRGCRLGGCAARLQRTSLVDTNSNGRRENTRNSGSNVPVRPCNLGKCRVILANCSDSAGLSHQKALKSQ